MKTKNREKNIKELIEKQEQEIKHLREVIWGYAPYMTFSDEKQSGKKRYLIPKL